jgi:hypothetical protein
MKVIFSLLFIFGIIHLANSQNSNHVSIEQLGISFDIPAGWQGQEFNGGLLLQHSNIPGVIFISTHNYSKAQLLQEAQNGMTDGQGTNLKLSGDVDQLSSTAIGGNYEGFLEGTSTRAYIIGVENPYLSSKKWRLRKALRNGKPGLRAKDCGILNDITLPALVREELQEAIPSTEPLIFALRDISFLEMTTISN